MTRIPDFMTIELDGLRARNIREFRASRIGV
jgi:hypothetical protein